MNIEKWLLIAVDVLLPVWIMIRIIMLPALANGPGHSRLLTTYVEYRAEQQGKSHRHR